MTQQTLELNRVRLKVADIVFAFCRQREADKALDGVFRLNELVEYVRRRVQGSGLVVDSVSRILRDLRQRGRIEYVILDRSDSLYKIMETCDNAEDEPI